MESKPTNLTPDELQLDAFLAAHSRDKAACREAILRWELKWFFFRRGVNEQINR